MKANKTPDWLERVAQGEVNRPVRQYEDILPEPKEELSKDQREKLELAQKKLDACMKSAFTARCEVIGILEHITDDEYLHGLHEQAQATFEEVQNLIIALDKKEKTLIRAFGRRRDDSDLDMMESVNQPIDATPEKSDNSYESEEE